MGPQPDVERLKEIYEAERQAERIVREAEDAGKALVAEAEAAARAALAEKRALLERRSAEALGEEAARIEREAQAFLEGARRRTDQWVRRSESGIDAIVDALLDTVLPS